MSSEDIFVTKKCAVCGAINDFYKKEELLRQMDYFVPEGEASKAFYMLWHNIIEECPDCNYVAEDISIADANSIMTVNSKEYKEIFFNEVIEDISEFENCDAYKYEAYAFLNKQNEKHFESATGYMRAFFETRQCSHIWYKEVGGLDGNDKTEDQVFKNGVNLSNEYLKRAQARLMSILNKQPDNVHALFLMVYALYYLNEKGKATTLIRKVAELNLSEIDKKITKHLYNLVVNDMFDWE